MADWNDLKKAFEKEIKKEEDIFFENEQKLHKRISFYICEQKGISPLQGYKPEELISFLEKSPKEIKQLLGGEWLDMSDDQFESLTYSLSKKVKKSTSLTTW